MQTDAKHGVSGQGVEASASATVQTAVAKSLRTPGVVSASDSSRMGDDDLFSLWWPTHGYGHGSELVVQGQAAIARSSGGATALRPGFASQTKVFYLVQPSAVGLETDLTLLDAMLYCRTSYEDIASITTEHENVLAAGACLLDVTVPMQRCMLPARRLLST